MTHGSACVGLVSGDFVVLAALRRAESELASYTRKITRLDDHVGAAVSGLIPDGAAQCDFLRHECIDEKWRYEAPVPIGRLVRSLGDKNQVYTQRSEKRPAGVGLLVAGYDFTGPHLFETSPSGDVWEFRAQAIGARSQAAKTYLEKHIDAFSAPAAGTGLREAVLHAVRSLKGAAQDKLTAEGLQIAYVGKDTVFTVLEDDDVREYVDAIAQEDLDAEAAAQPAAMVEDA